MGSSAMMEDSSSTRHRRRTATTSITAAPAVTGITDVPSLWQVPSGDDNDPPPPSSSSSNNNHNHHHHSAKGRTTNLRKKQKQHRRRLQRDEPPFWKLVVQVGTIVLVVGILFHMIYRRVYPYDPNAGFVEEIVYIVDDDADNGGDGAAAAAAAAAAANGGVTSGIPPDQPSSPDYTEKDEVQVALLAKQQKQHAKEAAEAVVATAATSKVPETAPPLPQFALSSASKWDVFGIVSTTTETTTTTTTTTTVVDRNSTFWQVADGLRRRFVERYGTENAARMLLDTGMTTFATGAAGAAGARTTNNDTLLPRDIHATACRFQAAREEHRPFRMAFGGYSVTAGRGNHYEQSFPFQLQRILETAVKMAGIPSLHVVNAAIGGSPAFPYGWCMKNFWDSSPDVVSWDYSMNEAGGVPEGLEAYIRHLIATYPDKVPKLIVKDTYLAALRRDVVGQYLEWLQDPVVLHTGPAVKPFLERPEAHNPMGFQEWRKFGAPEGSPGQALHHPALKEHELMGWMLAMHFLTALEYLESRTTGEKLKCPPTTITTLPPPVTGHNTTNYDGTLFGHAQQSNPETWKMNPVQCRTTFQPSVSGDLSELVVTGTVAEELDVVLPKSQMYYNEGWTYDVSEEERQMKRKLSLYENGLGFVDSKEAYYGIYESPVMHVLLPYVVGEPPGHDSAVPHVGQPALDWFESIVVCQVHEKRDATACNMASDVGFVVGGMNATFRMMKDTGTLYLGKPVCIKLAIPANATMTSHNTLVSKPEQHLEMDQVGLLVAINVTNPHIAHIHQACSVSHIVWEQRLVDRTRVVVGVDPTSVASATE